MRQSLWLAELAVLIPALVVHSALGFSLTTRSTTTVTSSVSFLPHYWGFSVSPAPRSWLCFSAVESVAAANNQEEIELIEDDVHLDRNSSFTQFRERLQELARMTSKDPTAVARATQVMDQMYQARAMTKDNGALLLPDTDIYNLLLEIHAYSANPEGANEAEAILRRMEDQQPGGNMAQPDLETYGKVMEAWTQRKQPEKAESIFQRLEQNENLHVNTHIYNKLIKAYGLSGDAARAESILEQLLQDASDDNKDGDIDKTHIKPDQKTWVNVLRAYASPKYRKEGVEKIQSLLRRMARAYRNDGEEDWKPRVEAYNALLKALSHQRGSAKEAEQVLYGMVEQYQGGEVGLRPNADSFVNVFNAYRGDTDASVSFKVEKLLDLQEAMVQGLDDDVRPTVRSYNSAMAAISRTRDPKKSVRARRFMDRMKHRDDQGDERLGPTLFTYKSLMNACAYTDGEPQDKLVAFQIAVDTLNELRESPLLKPDASIFGLFLRACANLMPSSRKRDSVVENVFSKCCKDGCLSDYVLQEFEMAASDELQLRVIGGFLEDGVRPPADWSRNVVEN
jgi:tetratricopeptide (TPR) repeat protein